MILNFFGPPGAGKGTQAKFISKKLNIIHLSTGDVLRDQLDKKTKLSLELIKTMKSGELVSDDTLNQIVSERISLKDCNNGFIFDGYPRTLSQAQFIDQYFLKNNLKFDYLIEFNVNSNSIIERITNRALVESRVDDSEKTIKTRLRKYNLETKPVIDHYKKHHGSIYYTIDGTQEIEQINSLLLKILKNNEFTSI